MPTKSELPPDLATLPEYHALTLDNAIWQVGIDRLLRSITPSGSLNKSPILALPTDAVTFDTVGRGDPSPDRSVSRTTAASVR